MSKSCTKQVLLKKGRVIAAVFKCSWVCFSIWKKNTSQKMSPCINGQRKTFLKPWSQEILLFWFLFWVGATLNDVLWLSDKLCSKFEPQFTMGLPRIVLPGLPHWSFCHLCQCKFVRHISLTHFCSNFFHFLHHKNWNKYRDFQATVQFYSWGFLNPKCPFQNFKQTRKWQMLKFWQKTLEAGFKSQL